MNPYLIEPTAHPEFWQNPGWAVVRFKSPITEPWTHPEFICLEAETLDEIRDELIHDQTNPQSIQGFMP